MSSAQYTVIYNIGQLVTLDADRCTAENLLGIVENAAVVLKDDRIDWYGASDQVDPSKYQTAFDVHGRVVMPGLIDSHTHTIFAGDRSDEFEMRLQGKTYLEIAQAGGGILKTVSATRQADEKELYELTHERLLRMLAFGVTTVEVKSGYGLDFDSELKCLRVLKELSKDSPVSIVPTYMGGHDIPPEYQGRTDEYVAEICDRQIPTVERENLAVFCDVFCEKGYFDVAQSRKILETARRHGLKLKIHAEEFCDLGGAELAGELGCVSADHLLHISEKGIAALKKGGTVATLLPGTAFYLRIKEYAPALKLLEAGVPVALATDFNPGSCMIDSLPLIMNLACLQMHMTPVDVIRAVTINAAKALDLDRDRGSITPGKRGDLCVFAIQRYQELLYHIGANPLSDVFIAARRYPRTYIEEHLAKSI